MEVMRTCKKCLKDKFIDEFRIYKLRSNKPYRMRQCKECERKWQREWYQRTKDRTYAVAQKNRWKRVYGLEEKEYFSLLEKQNYKCAICKIHQDDCKNNLSVDHCHDTKKVRGLLCSRCNFFLGAGKKEGLERTTTAIKYLQKFYGI